MRDSTVTNRREFLSASAALAASLALESCSKETQPGTAGGNRGTGEGRRPNVLFILTDQQRHDWTGLNSDLPIPTPNLVELASRGVAFSNAIVAAPVCGPSRACLASGVEYERCGVPKNVVPYPDDAISFYKRLRESGYHVMGAGKLDLGRHGQEWAPQWGFSVTANIGGKKTGMHSYRRNQGMTSDLYYRYLEQQVPPLGALVAEDMHLRHEGEKEDWMSPFEPSPVDDRHYLDNWIARTGVQMIEEAPRSQPWFLAVNFAGPHSPNDITSSMAAKYRGPDRVIDDFPAPHAYDGSRDRAWHLACRQNYAAMIENIDRWLRRYQRVIDTRGELENTLIVFSSDHGEMLGDRGQWGKQLPYQASVGVPLIVAGPGIQGGRRSPTPISLMDLAATFLDYGGVPIPSEMDSVSARAFLEGRSDTHREYVFSAIHAWRLVFDGRHKFVTGYGQDDLLFDLEADPLEDHNLLAEAPDLARRLRYVLESRG